jgi:hypothetical protein
VTEWTEDEGSDAIMLDMAVQRLFQHLDDGEVKSRRVPGGS